MDWIGLLSSTTFGALIREIVHGAKYVIAKKQASKKYFMDTSELYTVMTDVLSGTNIDRWTVLVVHNSGKPLNMLTESFLTILWEDYDKGLKPRKQSFQRFPLDRSFHKFFKDAYINGSAVSEIATEDGTTDLYHTLAQAGMKHSEVFFQLETKKGLYFIALSSTTKSFKEITQTEKGIIQLAVSKARALFVKSAKYLN